MTGLIVSPQHRKIITPWRADLANLLPHATSAVIKGQQSLVIPHLPDETRLMRNLGIDAPPPILVQYDWNGGTPFDIQKRTAGMLTINRRAYVLNDMGTGKTRTSLWALDFLMKTGQAKKALIVAPISTLEIVWVREIKMHFPHLSTSVLYGTKERRKQRLAADADIYIINHHGLAVMKAELMTRTDIDVIVIDELAVLRNASSALNKIARVLCATRGWVWGMTGSPTPNSPVDAFGQTLIVTPGTAGHSVTRFRERMMDKVSEFRWIPKKDAVQRVAAVFTPAVRFKLDDVVELPDVVFQDRQVPMSQATQDAYHKFRTAMSVAFTQGSVTPANEAALLNKLLQVSCGFVYLPDGSAVSLDPSPRLQVVEEVAETAANHKLIVFAPFVAAIREIEAHLNNAGHVTTAIYSEMSDKKRGEVFWAFQNTPEPHVIVAHPAIAAHGLTLTAASTILWYGPIWSLELFEQANRRITRIGQTLKQLVVMLQSSAAERRAYKRLMEKQKMQGLLLDILQTE